MKLFKKTQSPQTLICSLLQAKHVVITQEKDNGVNIVLSYRSQQNVGIDLGMILMLKQFPLQLGKVVAAAS